VEGAIPAGSTVVCVLTGHGLKDPEWAIAGAGRPATVAADAAAVAAELGL
jgi:threonine synthase